MHCVVITGIGIISPVGNNVPCAWNSVINGKSGISSELNLGGENPPLGLVKISQEELDKIIDPAKQRRSERFTQLALIAGGEAMRDAGLDANFPQKRENIGIYLGVGIGGLSLISESSILFESAGKKKISPFLIPKIIANQAPASVAEMWNLQGPAFVTCNACASSGDAIGLAFRAIRDGYQDIMLAGGAESCITPISYSAFSNMRATASWQGDAQKACRPFDKDRSGFVMSEGAAVLVLERKDIAQKRGAKIYAEIVGYGATTDAYHLTAMHPEGRGAKGAMQIALNDAKISCHEINYINAHGTGTQMNDAIETRAIKEVFGERAKNILVSSTKSMTGHMLGASAALEAAFCTLALRDQIVPPTINLDNPDPECDLDYVPHVARKSGLEYALSNSFGFGGGNAVLVFKKI